MFAQFDRCSCNEEDELTYQVRAQVTIDAVGYVDGDKKIHDLFLYLV